MRILCQFMISPIPYFYKSGYGGAIVSSLCQSNAHSCGACCGIFNLNVSKQELDHILRERTEDFQKNTNFQTRWTLSAYRKRREELEEEISRVDKTTYVCPFLGMISSNRIGCMIHPVYSGDPKSQNLSFYGASICQGYDCKTKEHQLADSLQTLLEQDSLDYFIYSNLVADYITFHLILEYFQSKGYELGDIFSSGKELFRKLIYWKFSIGYYLNQTSFDFPEQREGTLFEKLVTHLQIKETDELYIDLQQISKNP
jgi:hypothetical protein